MICSYSRSDKFQLDFTIHNLQKSSAHIYLGADKTELAAHSSQSLSLAMNKLNIFERLDADNFNQLISELFNTALTETTEICLGENSSVKLRFENTALLLKRRDLVVMCPLGIEAHLKLGEMEVESSELRLAALALVLGRRAVASRCLEAYDFRLWIDDKKRNKVLNSAHKSLVQASVRFFQLI